MTDTNNVEILFSQTQLKNLNPGNMFVFANAEVEGVVWMITDSKTDDVTPDCVLLSSGQVKGFSEAYLAFEVVKVVINKSTDEG